MRKKMTVAVALAATLAVLGACSTDRGDGGGSAGGANTDTLNMTAHSATSTFVRNYNGFSPAAKKSPGVQLIYEPLIRVNHMNEKKIEGWLAESYEFGDDGRSIIFRLRDDVTWSDGEPFTAEDVVFTFETVENGDGLGINPLGYSDIEAPNEHTVVVSYDQVAYQRIADYYDHNIYPEHIWKDKKLDRWTNPDPVGTGPATLESFSPQQIELKLRQDYWGGKPKGVRYVDLKTFATPETGKAMLLKGELDWSSINWQNAEEEFIAKDPENHHYWVYSTGGGSGLDFNTAKAPLDNVHLRRALAYAVDPQKVLSLTPTGQQVANITGLDEQVYGGFIGEEFRGRTWQQDLDRAKRELTASGFEINANGVLSKDGKSYPLTLKTVQEYTNWSAWAQGVAEQWRQELGLRVKVSQQPEDQLFDQLAEGDYDISFDWQAGGYSAWNGFNTVLNSANTAPIGEKAATNNTRWSHRETDRILAEWNRTKNVDEQRELAAELQRIVVEQMPYASMFTEGWYVDVNAGRWKGWPDPKDTDYVPHPTLPADAILTVLNLEPAG